MTEKSHYRPSILLVEDEALTREQLGELLQSWTPRVYLAENGEEGLSIYNSKSPDIVITDILMPVMNGLEMARRIRKGDPKAKIIGLTAYSEISDLGGEKEMAADYIVLKPIDMERLLEMMDRCRETILAEKGIKPGAGN